MNPHSNESQNSLLWRLRTQWVDNPTLPAEVRELLRQTDLALVKQGTHIRHLESMLGAERQFNEQLTTFLDLMDLTYRGPSQVMDRGVQITLTDLQHMLEGWNCYRARHAGTHNPYAFQPGKERAFWFWQRGHRAAEETAVAAQDPAAEHLHGET